MASRPSSPPLIKGIDGIVSRPPNKVNYSTLNGKRMESGKQPGNEIRQIFQKYGISGNYVKDENKAKDTSKTDILSRQGDENKNEMVGNNAESNGEDGGATRKKQQQKCGNSTPMANNQCQCQNQNQNQKVSDGTEEATNNMETDEGNLANNAKMIRKKQQQKCGNPTPNDNDNGNGNGNGNDNDAEEEAEAQKEAKKVAKKVMKKAASNNDNDNDKRNLEKYIEIDAITKQWKIDQHMEEQQCDTAIENYMEEYKEKLPQTTSYIKKN